MNISVFLGAPGSGKGTQAKRLAESFNFQHFSTGDMLRSEIKSQTELGNRAKRFIDSGELVPDDLMIEMISKKLRGLSDSARIVLDGFPRTVKQAEALDLDRATTVAKALYFEVPEDILVSRLTGRRICTNCGDSYHTEFLPPKNEGICDKCGAKLIQRTDDSEEVVRRRLEIFQQQTKQLINYYESKKSLTRLNGNQNVDSLQSDLLNVLQ